MIAGAASTSSAPWIETETLLDLITTTGYERMCDSSVTTVTLDRATRSGPQQVVPSAKRRRDPLGDDCAGEPDLLS
jgi:hypothetical protein